MKPICFIFTSIHIYEKVIFSPTSFISAMYWMVNENLVFCSGPNRYLSMSINLFRD